MRRLMVVLVLLAPSLAWAQWAPGSGDGITRPELTVFGGYRDGGRVEGFDTVVFPFKFTADLEGSASYGLALDLPVSADRQMELWVSRQSGALQSRYELSTGSRELGDLDVTYLHLGLVQSWFRRFGTVYVGVGAGVTLLEPQVTGGSADTRFSASLATGAKYVLSPHVGLRVDLRGYWTAANDALSNHSNAAEFGYSSNFVQGEASVGVTLRW